MAYTELLIEHLLKVDQENEYVVFYNSREFLGRFPTAREITLPLTNRLVWDYVALPLWARREHVDLVWTPSYIIPFTLGLPAVASCLDNNG